MNRDDAYEQIRRRAVDLVEERGIDVAADRRIARGIVTGAVDEYQRQAQVGRGRALADPSDMAERVLRSVAEFGALTELLERPDLEEVFIEGSRVSYLASDGRLRALDQPTSERENRQVVDRLLGDADRRLDVANPMVQARVLADSARLTAVIAPVADRLSVTIRRYALRKETLGSLVELSALTGPAAGFLWATMQATTSVLVSGPPGAGKTSLLSALVNAAPPAHCIRCCEEVRELHVPLVHGSFYEARPPALDGSGEVTLRELLKIILAMRPDRIVVGEVRGAEAFELTRAANAGCGLACTIHANSAADALAALVNAALMAGENVTERVVSNIFASSLDLVVHLDRDTVGDGPIRRQVVEILAVVPSLHADFSTEPIFSRQHLGAPLEWTGLLPPQTFVDRVDRALPGDLALRAILEGEEVVL